MVVIRLDLQRNVTGGFPAISDMARKQYPYFSILGCRLLPAEARFGFMRAT